MNEDEITQPDFEVETEWKRVTILLNRKDEPALSMAVLEAHKIFRQILNEVSFGGTIDDQIHNAGELFKDINGVLAADLVQQHIVEQVGHRITKADAQTACDALMKAILDMVGRDFELQGFWHRWANGLNYFWGHHPRLLAGLLAGILAFVVLIWFLADTLMGQWVASLLVGFAHFILGWSGLIIGLVVAIIISLAIGLTYADRQRRR
ncbi:hypothetical protein A3K24_02275 [candidate division Kazan bacterium RIFCSPHIGHO2_01_FULL_44_14]|uniref:Uncharacterized protein n=1 Tax=candidate division Kazan bacterium RIFCSPLOWO2_01_FULL_45_19 TaxID=1798538 RepID=A0A1F4NQK4_UNCK3|nr:hypothetical protein [uncultured bacterium]AQS31068.1 hypothetical protein [uncultured bacterium]OGB73646.1 MAG: hypothetical protein A3K51_02275 [candidate division Kazan bacterium RIFCSPLOWO2_01_FULL_45_19]OGB77891.1 MAG: hypothetical protein A3K24_02275 [candidate division Kazan bacterium RIFCSPHIGHO2_01_FULL_44_14]